MEEVDKAVKPLIDSVGKGAGGLGGIVEYLPPAVAAVGVVVNGNLIKAEIDYTIEANKSDEFARDEYFRWVALKQKQEQEQKEREKQQKEEEERKRQAEQRRQNPPSPSADSEHTKGKRPSTKQDHERNKARKKRERDTSHPSRKHRPQRKRPDGHKGPWPPK